MHLIKRKVTDLREAEREPEASHILCDIDTSHSPSWNPSNLVGRRADTRSPASLLSLAVTAAVTRKIYVERVTAGGHLIDGYSKSRPIVSSKSRLLGGEEGYRSCGVGRG